MRGQFPFDPLDLIEGGANASSKLEWIATAVGRVGTTIDRAIVCAGGGAAWTHEKDCINFNLAEFSDVDSSGSNTSFGWTLLAGLEYMIDPHWSARIQYNFYDFEDQNVNLNFNNSEMQSVVGPEPIPTDLRIHSVTAGVNYRF